ncbi:MULTISPECIES: hypothetical protein [Ralstonia]|uniref:DUF2946 domain-containing protein n=1 Tax=Ralstonia holmesii TaxID=3058602 RepID=A0ABC8QEK5_9RALS|nr:MULTISPECIES: hypothetical protein [unclassified Ralstonia]CAJ0788425.1 hypothetical protein LMG18096_02107 [Ralstonia sp. LMG 32967]CAJ0809015.1 hypothetical protein LMG18093_00613 [Ralstonia sp. LMG 32967]
MSSDIVRRHLRPTLRSFRSSLLHLRWLACLLTVFLLFGQQGALRHALSHWSELSEGTAVEFNAAATAKPAGAQRSQPAQEHAACLQCAAYAALAAALPMLVALRLAHTRRWHFPRIGFHAGAPVFPVAVCSRDPPFRL